MEGGLPDLGGRRTLSGTAKRRRRRNRRGAPPDVRREHARARRVVPVVSDTYVRPQLRLRDRPRVALPRRRAGRTASDRNAAGVRGVVKVRTNRVPGQPIRQTRRFVLEAIDKTTECITSEISFDVDDAAELYRMIGANVAEVDSDAE